MESLIAPFLNGSADGALLLVAALGLALTFGQMGVINMAHGEFLLAGALAAYWTQQAISDTNVSTLVALPVAFVFSGVLGLVLEVAIIQWMYHRPLDTLLATVGVSLTLQQVVLQRYPSGVPVSKPSLLNGQVDVFGYAWPLRQVFTIVLALVCLLGLAVWLKNSSFGRRIRATVQNRALAETLGVPTRTIDRITFFVGSGLAGIGGVAASLIGGTNSQLGTRYIILAFLVVVAGGLGQLRGTVIAAWTVGVVTAYLADWTSGSIAQVITFVLVVVFLQVKPQGLFAVRTRGLA